MASKHGHLRFTPPWLQTDDYLPGPCYVLDPKAWMQGRRVVIDVIEPKIESKKRPASSRQPAPEPTETRQIVRWPPGRPLEWEIVEAPVRRSEPAWAAAARELRAQGWSIRRIMRKLGVSSRRQLCELLDR